MRLYLALACLALSLALVACGNATSDTSDPGTIGEKFKQATSEDVVYGTFAAALQTPALADVLDELDSDYFPHTVFAPTNEAFAAYFKAQGITKEEFLAQDNLREIILTHIVRGVLNADRIAPEAAYENMNGTMLTISGDGDELFVNGAPFWGPVRQQDPAPESGFIYFLNKGVISP